MVRKGREGEIPEGIKHSLKRGEGRSKTGAVNETKEEYAMS